MPVDITVTILGQGPVTGLGTTIGYSLTNKYYTVDGTILSYGLTSKYNTVGSREEIATTTHTPTN